MLPTVFSVFGFSIPAYGVLVALAFLIALAVTGKLARRSGLDSETVLNLGIYCVLAGILGAKVFMVLSDWRHYMENPGEIFSFSTLQSGGIFYGGLIAALLTASFYMRAKSLPPLKTADAFAPGLALGHAIGRLGCFAAGCCWGVETRLPWAVTFMNPRANAVTGVPLGIPLHPTQLYESIGEAIIFAFLYHRFQRQHRTGAIIGSYLVLYSLLRFVVDFVRYHDQPNPFGGPLTAAQWISLALIALVTALFLSKREKAPALTPAAAPRR
jgi:phosphatidylglycerol:prolipoprotein diacylglycerol transferase